MVCKTQFVACSSAYLFPIVNEGGTSADLICFAPPSDIVFTFFRPLPGYGPTYPCAANNLPRIIHKLESANSVTS